MATAVRPSERARACVADDGGGELDDVRALLTELGVAWCGPEADGASDTDLWVTTPRHAVARSGSAGCGVHIVLAAPLSRSMRAQLQRSPCDFIIERPAHPAAIRLLMVHSLYRGPERRQRPRVPIREEVRIKSGLRSRPALLLQLSARGCGLLLSDGFDGSTLRVCLPSRWSGEGDAWISGRVLSRSPDAAGGCLLSIGFTGLDARGRAALSAVLQSRSRADGRLSPRAEAAPTGASPRRRSQPVQAAPEPCEPDGSERRVASRATYRRRILASGVGQAYALVGRDLSTGGMRVGPDTALELGQELKLALYGSRGVPPVAVRARVVRDDGADGLGLQFEPLADDARRRLGQLVDALSVLGRRGEGGEAERPRTVIGEVIDPAAEPEAAPADPD